MLRLCTPGSRPGDTKAVSTPWPLGATGWVSLKVFETQTLNSLYLGFQVAYQRLTQKNILRTPDSHYYDSPVKLDAYLPVIPGIMLLHWHSRLETWRCPAKQQLHPSSKTPSKPRFFACIMLLFRHAHRRTTSWMFPFTENEDFATYMFEFRSWMLKFLKTIL